MGDIETIILCGGMGTRAYPDTRTVPKPLLEVDGMPIVEHVMGIYAAQGHTRFVLAAGYLGDQLADRYRDGWRGLRIAVVDTGESTETGDRLRLAAEHVEGPTFFATYADGLGDVDLGALLAQHLDRGRLATVTTVPLPSQYGTLIFDDEDGVVDFREKPVLDDHWINAGYFVFQQEVFGSWQGPVLERDVLPSLGRTGQLTAYRHRGFWKSMDTFKDRQELETLAGAGAPWKRTAEDGAP